MKKICCFFMSILIALSMSAGSVCAQANYTNYSVRSGDTLSKIANKNGVSLNQIISLNPKFSKSTAIYVGETIKIPVNGLTGQENEVLRLVNVERAKYGLPALKANVQLFNVARIKSKDMLTRNYFSHTSPTFGSTFSLLTRYGISYAAAGENIAYGYVNAASVMRGWMNSPGHRANILGKQYRELGVGAAKSSNGQIYWTQVFIKR
ncbi:MULTISPECIES: CAP domain-containing protein [Clostridium]|uniref:CAP domain-containing protein n=1 Tax=Clostridium TaxID=1485 RepID=UPI000826EACC|nr:MULTISPECIES: CAP domain-containing protein [Clostridium]PJI09805.1 LysM peptidoglycan-binding domain-containing protein [Clostridium sp. CT7]